MTRKIVFVLLVSVLMLPMGLFAASRLGVNIGYADISTGYYADQYSSSEYEMWADDQGVHVQLDYDYLFNSHVAVNAQADVDFANYCSVGGKNVGYTKYTPKIGYGLKAGVNFYLSFLRLGTGLRYQITNAGFTGGVMSIRSLFISMNADLVLNMGEKYALVIGAEYGFPLSSKMTNKADSGGSLTTDLNIAKRFLKDGDIIIYGGFQFKF